MTIFEQEQFNWLANEFINQVRNAIKNKPIKRKTKAHGEFEAVANASGRLSDSLRSEITENEINVYSLAYIDNLIYGQAPSRVNTTVFEIENWMNSKGLEYSATSVLDNLQQYGNSIFQKFGGSESNFLEDIDLSSHIETVKQNLILKKINEIKYANSNQ